MGWSYKFWPLYDGLKPSEFLSNYAKHFNSVEINSSFYRIPSQSVVENWASQVPKGFRFTAKIPRSISHASELNYQEGKLEAFLRNISKLGGKLGPLLLQLPAKFRVDKVEKLEDFLSVLPKEYMYAVEFRNRGWFKDEIYELLRENSTSLVQVEHNRFPAVNELTTDFVYVRWEGDRKQVNGERGYVEVDRKEGNKTWGVKLKRYLEDGLDVYGFFSKFYSGYPVSDIKMTIEAL
jgi:uncharacterized protein YecE (DUF72 family)